MFTKAVYAARRQRLAKDVAKGIILILGNSDAPANYPDNCYTFRQDSNFLYFFGLNDPDLAAVIDAETGEEILFGDEVSRDDIMGMGPQTSIAAKAASVGVKKSRKYADLQKDLTAAKKA